MDMNTETARNPKPVEGHWAILATLLNEACEYVGYLTYQPARVGDRYVAYWYANYAKADHDQEIASGSTMQIALAAALKALNANTNTEEA